MARILFFLLLGVAAYVAYRWWRLKLAAPQRRERVTSEPMVRCEHCGINLPESEAVAAGSRRFCSTEHRRLATGE